MNIEYDREENWLPGTSGQMLPHQESWAVAQAGWSASSGMIYSRLCRPYRPDFFPGIPVRYFPRARDTVHPHADDILPASTTSREYPSAAARTSKRSWVGV